jgi:polar amino acid transport system permease protein
MTLATVPDGSSSQTFRPPAKRTRYSPVGMALVGVWIAIGLFLVAVLVASLNASLFAVYGPRLLHGLWVTLYLVAASISLGAIISLPIAAGLRSRNRLLRGLAFAYSFFFRGTPLIAQVFLVYYGAGQLSPMLKSLDLWWFFRDAVNCAIFSFSLNTAAYQAEILAGAIRAVPNGQWEAAKALALPRFVTMSRVVLPQALITALRPYGNEVILMIKASAIASIITVLDLMGETRYAFSKTLDLSLYLWAAVLYLLMVEIIRRVWARLERRLTRHIRQV